MDIEREVNLTARVLEHLGRRHGETTDSDADLLRRLAVLDFDVLALLQQAARDD